MGLAGFRKRRSNGSSSAEGVKEGPLSNDQGDAKKATKTRRNAIIVASFCYLVGWVFLILVEIGNTKATRVLGDIYFFKLDLSDIIPQSVPNLTLLNSIARTLGLHDFYQVGLWNFCEGYEDEGITHCSKPTKLFWFNPVEILKNELFAGASIALPSEVNTILYLLQIASNVMFGFFITGLVLDFVLMCASPIVLYSRWWSLPFALLAFVAALFVTAATIIGTAMSLIFKYALTSQSDLNVVADVGVKMFAFMWIATAFTVLAFFIHASLGCCCTSRRDLRTGRKGGKGLTSGPNSEPASELNNEEKPKQRFKVPNFGKKTAPSS
ncbi:SUR7/PalI family-domain-containing protein [Pseudomassariella vexata]|uniref:SUR7/PalI family-domain-containing protein n=1 Tax=Pseudomassariella vexata TaxID=1141098 RepID=A0A1Y2DV81_9PEZI|nr:SUR7/PalI family-domain-containing protein [Pseudomassariella vexata]ORY63044.1 SUR7/PalI family-domain-containing protein [Pseudomassariella vexata]